MKDLEETRTELRDIIARNNTGYSYEELKQAIIDGEDLLEDNEVVQVDKTVNTLIRWHVRESMKQSLAWRIEQMRRVRTFMPKATYEAVMGELAGLEKELTAPTQHKEKLLL